MGIYSDEKIYGISIRMADEILFEQTYLTPMTHEDIKSLYDTLTEQKKNVLLLFYKSFSSTLEPGNYMAWVPGTL